MLDNRSRVYALESWTVEKKRRGWFIKAGTNEMTFYYP